MRWPSFVMAVSFLATLAGGMWVAGCNDLSSDCELNLNCTPTAPPPVCNNAFYPGACGACVQQECCKEYADCRADGFCEGACVYGALPLDPQCVSGPSAALFQPLDECMKANCAVDCPPADQCNPVTHKGCKMDGTACEIVYPGIFVCIPPFGTPGGLCQACSFSMPPFCGSTFRCDPTSLTCGRYCCADADCGPGARCELDQMRAFGAPLARPEDKVGICVMGDPAAQTPDCAAPAIPLSGGACFGGFAP